MVSSAKVITSTKLEYAYDFASRRTSKTVHNYTNASWVQSSGIKFVYQGRNLIAEVDAATGSVLRTYLWGEDASGSMQGAGGVGGLLAVTDSSGTYYPVYDGNGNIRAYTDASGSVVAEYEYDAFGKIISQSGSKADDFVFRFSNKYYDKEIGLYYYGYRYYSPAWRRWLSRDPIGEKGGVNLYGFVQNSPIMFYDILGLDGESVLHWHHNAVQELPKLLAKRGMKLASDVKIDSVEYGVLLEIKDHIYKDGLHSQGFNQEWQKWVEKLPNDTKEVTNSMIRDQINKMYEDERFGPIMRNGRTPEDATYTARRSRLRNKSRTQLKCGSIITLIATSLLIRQDLEDMTEDIRQANRSSPYVAFDSRGDMYSVGWHSEPASSIIGQVWSIKSDYFIFFHNGPLEGKMLKIDKKTFEVLNSQMIKSGLTKEKAERPLLI